MNDSSDAQAFVNFESLLSNPDCVRELVPGLYTTLPHEDAPAPYDRRAVGYDAVLKWPLYHRVFWGT